MERKICSKCKIEKDVCEFHKFIHSKDGHRNICKNCRKSEKIKNSEYVKKNIEKIKLKNKMWVEKNPEYFKKYTKEYNKKNRKKLNKKLKNWRDSKKTDLSYKLIENYKKREKYNNNINYRLKQIFRSRLNKIIKYKKEKKSLELIGCTIDEFIVYIENKFQEGMTWDNYGYFGWHIDHIIPISSASSEEEIHKLCHFTNLQPLWSVDNLKKSNKILKNLNDESPYSTR